MAFVLPTSNAELEHGFYLTKASFRSRESLPEIIVWIESRKGGYPILYYGE